jgi:3-phytase
MKTIQTLFCIFTASLLAACGQNKLSIDSIEVNVEALPFNGEHGFIFSDKQRLSYGPDHNIVLSDELNTVLDQQPLKAEFLDHRKINNQTVIFAINENSEPSLIKRNQGSLVIKHGAVIETPLEGLCLYQTSGMPLQVFLLDESHMASQYLVNELNDSIELQLLRRFPLPPGAQSCAVHDDSDQFFVSEENIGIWAYSARAESEIKRTPVDLVMPYGKLEQDSGPLAVTGNTLFVAQSGHNIVKSYDIKPNLISEKSIIKLDNNIELDSLTISQSNKNNLQFIALNDENNQLIGWTLPYKDNTQTTNKIVNIPALVETTPVKTQGDAADDPAIWVHPTDTQKSLILGTNKKRGLYVYNLQGEEVQELLVQRVNNVDVRQGFTHKGQPADIAAASQRDRNSIALFHINPSSGLLNTVNEIKTGLDHVYGLCMYKGLNQHIYVFINDQDGRFEQWLITDSQAGWEGKRVREFAVASQPEGCTVDESQQRLFFGEENHALWTLGAEPNDSTNMEMISKVGDVLTADIEGMEIYAGKDKNWLVVSSQGNDSYVIFEAQAPYKTVGEFRIGLNQSLNIDGASETDGLTVSSVSFGEQFPDGLLVVQDGRNFMPEENQNYKLVSWRDISQALNF